MDILKSRSKTSPAARQNRWRLKSALFPASRSDEKRILEDLPQILETVWPLDRNRRKSLPYDIRDLSRALTSQRSDLKTPYWKKPAWISAYLYYFLPWNLARLIRLFNGLRLPKPEFNKKPLLIDAGSGPLTLPIALWIARPDWRMENLKILAVDSARQPLELGLKIFDALCEKFAIYPWRIALASDPVWRLSPAFGKRAGKLDASPWMITSANVLNEAARLDGDEYGDDGDDEDDSLFKILMSWEKFRDYASFAGILAIEPGTRLGGSTIMRLRKRGIQMGYFPTAPCVSSGVCPLLGTKGSDAGGLSEKWCHFTFAADDAPKWLATLSEEARLAKKTLSLSMVLLETREAASHNPSACRVISHTFPIPDLSDACRYGCASEGLRVLPDSQSLPSGSLTAGRSPKNLARDKRSGALVLEPLEDDVNANSTDKSPSPRKGKDRRPPIHARRSKI